MVEVLPKYLEDPERYCSRINSLLNQNSNEWQTVWKAAIPELCNLSCNKLRDINSLLKPIESAFKSKDLKLRVQAFECWSHFLSRCPEISVSRSEKLWNVLAVPLTAQNHSVYIVLSAKLKTWDAFVDAAFQSYPNALKTVTPTVLKCLYGPSPQNVEPACKFSALSETCGQLYLKVMKKCSVFPAEVSLIFSYLGKAIPPLSNSSHTLKLAKLIWSEALNIMSKGGWQTEHFNYLMRTLENLFSDHQNDGFQLLGNFLAIIFNIHVNIPPDRLTPHMNLLIRCLFHPPIKKTVLSDIMNSMLKRCENPSFYFYEVDRVLMDKIEDDRTDVDVLWIALASCYTKWVKNKSLNRSDRENDANEIDTSLKVLLFPFEHFNEISYETDRFNEIMKQWKLCYEECVTSIGSEKFMPVLFAKMEASIDDKISRLIVATYMCNTILTVTKFYEEFIHMKGVLLKIKRNMPDMKLLTDSKLNSFAIKYIITIKGFVQFVKPYQDDFSDVIETFSFLLPKDANETMSKADLLKSDREESNNTMMTPAQKRNIVFAKMLSPSLGKSNIQSPSCSPSSSTASKINDDDVQMIEIKPKPKNSPMTQHQLEKAKSKRYIPALYQDLSQDPSQSRSQSLSQIDSEDLFIENKKRNISINPELFEENANLPAITNTSNNAIIVPRLLSFSTGLNSSVPDKSDKDFSNACSLNNDNEQRNNYDLDSSIEVMPKSKTFTDAASNDCEILDKQRTKRKNLRENETPNDVTPVKRSKRLMNRVENSVDDKNSTKTRKFTMSPFFGRKFDGKSCSKDDKRISDNAEETEVVDLEKEQGHVAPKVKGVDVCVSRTANSLITLRSENQKSSKTRKSLRGRNGTPKSATLRKLRSSLLEDDSKKSTDSDDSVSDQQSNRDDKKLNKKSSNLFSAYVVVQERKQPHQFDQVASSTKLTLCTVPLEEINVEKESLVAKEENTIVKSENSPKKSTLNDSVILVDESVTEVISIDDSESANAVRKFDEGTIFPSVPDISSVPVPNSSDESTFYEGSDLTTVDKEQPIVTSNDENVISENIRTINHNATVPNALEIEKLLTSPEVILSTDSGNAVENNVIDDCTIQRSIETSAIESNLISHESAFNESECNVQSSSTKETSNDEITANEENVNGGDKISIELEPSSLLLNPNSRGFYIRSLAQGPDFPMNPSKSPKTVSPKHTHRTRENLYRSPISSRTIKILSENNKLPSTPTQRGTPTPEENEKSPYTPRNYPRRSILKTPDSKRSDANQNTSSPKSPKLKVSFAEKDQIKLFQADNESDSDSSISTGDKLSNENLLNEKLRSQDMLYSPLQNCKDSIEPVLSYIFSSVGSRQALKFFKSIGVDKVGQLASMSTLTASSIPAGDNRVRRIRHALKKYDEYLESEHRRRPSTRRSEFKNIEISCLMNLPVDVYSTADIENHTEEEREEPLITDDPQPAEDTLSKEVPVFSSEQQTPHEEPMVTDISTTALDPMKDETENDDTAHTKDPKQPVIVLNREIKESDLKLVESEAPVIEDDSNVESSEMTEKEVVKKVENKENVDPHSDVENIVTTSESSNISCCGIEPMQVDEQPHDISKITNESINESADYVCTDSTTREEDKNDRRSITMRDIHRYSTVIESNGKKVEKTPETVIVANDTNVNEAVFLFNENKTISESEEVMVLQKTVSDSQGTSISMMDSVIVISSIDQQSTVGEPVGKTVEPSVENEETPTEKAKTVYESILSKGQNNDNIGGNVIPQNVVNYLDTMVVERQYQKDFEQSVANCQERLLSNDDKFVFEHYFDGLTEVFKDMFPYMEPSENQTRNFFLKFWKKMSSISPNEFELHFVRKK